MVGFYFDNGYQHHHIRNINITLDFGKCKDAHVGSSFTSLPVLSEHSLYTPNEILVLIP
jgi:hypothetical protein